MNLSEIRAEAWDIARETATSDVNRLWSIREMNRYINRVYRHIARETKCIRDAYTAAVCQIQVAPPASYAALEVLAATSPFYAYDLAQYNTVGSWMYQTLVAPRVVPLHPSILDIDEIKWETSPWRLTKVHQSKWQVNPRWEQVTGTPTEYTTDYQSDCIALNFRYTSADKLLLCVRRLPLVALSANDDIPEVRTSYHDFFINGILEQMYSKQDAETIDLKKAANYHAAYKADIDEIKQQEIIYDQRLHPNYSMTAFR